MPFQKGHKLGIGNKYNVGKKLSIETRKKIGKALTGRIATEQMRTKLRIANIGKKHSEEAKFKMSIAKIGRKFSDETRKKMSDAAKGKKKSLQSRQRLSIARKGMIFSRVHKRNISLALKGKTGSMGHNWQGGIDPLVFIIRGCDEYSRWRLGVYRKDNFACQKCGSKREIHAHHIKSFKTLLNEAKMEYSLMNLYDAALSYKPLWDINNGITLCKECHLNTRRKHEKRIN